MSKLLLLLMNCSKNFIYTYSPVAFVTATTTMAAAGRNLWGIILIACTGIGTTSAGSAYYTRC